MVQSYSREMQCVLIEKNKKTSLFSRIKPREAGGYVKLESLVGSNDSGVGKFNMKLERMKLQSLS